MCIYIYIHIVYEQLLLLLLLLLLIIILLMIIIIINRIIIITRKGFLGGLNIGQHEDWNM